MPLRSAGALAITVRARALETDAPQTIELVWNDIALGPQPMVPAWSDYRVDVPAPAVRAGTNIVVLRFARAPVFHRVRGHGPRQMRAAAVAWIDLRRRER